MSAASEPPPRSFALASISLTFDLSSYQSRSWKFASIAGDLAMPNATIAAVQLTSPSLSSR